MHRYVLLVRHIDRGLRVDGLVLDTRRNCAVRVTKFRAVQGNRPQAIGITRLMASY
jgi:hypothetical protein